MTTIKKEKSKEDNTFKDETTLRKEFTALPEVKDFSLIDSQMQRLDAAMEEAKTSKSLVAVDQTLITILNKLLDPTSVVRESEYARTPQDLGIISRLKGKILKLNEGGAGLTQDERDAISRMGRNFYNIAKKMYSNQVNYYTNLAQEYEFNPKHVVRLGGEIREIAPPGAIELLKKNPQLKDEFLKKYKYLPEGF